MSFSCHFNNPIKSTNCKYSFSDTFRATVTKVMFLDDKLFHQQRVMNVGAQAGDLIDEG